MSTKRIRTIGILAHVDAGKTSITERLLHRVGATRTLGSVDKGSAVTDGLAMEKSRGISIKASSVNFTWEDCLFQLVDTPGHIDFAAEVDRSLSVLDAVVLVVSAKEGVQAHTLSLWESLMERGLPVIVFFNKIDRAGVDLEQLFIDFEQDLGGKLFALNTADLTDVEQPVLQAFGQDWGHAIMDKSLENLADCDEAFLDQYLEGALPEANKILTLAKSYMQQGMLYPCLFGSAKMDLGIEDLLQVLSTLELQTTYLESVAAKVFNVSFQQRRGRLAHIKLYGGKLQSKDLIWSQELGREVKVNQLFKPDLGDLEQVAELWAGEIGLVTTSEVILAGDILGRADLGEEHSKISEAVLTVQVLEQEAKDYQRLGEALEILNIEDPTLDFKWFKEEREFHLKILGPIQTEVLKENLWQRWEVSVDFQPPKVIYKETPSKEATGYVRYWMPKPCWAIMTFLIEPAPLGTGVEFVSKVRTSDIAAKYVNEVKRAIPWTLKQGIHGYEVTDLRITLIEGEDHNVHSNPGDFLLATPMGVLRGLDNAGTDLLEPMYDFEIKAKQDLLGAISSDLSQLGGQISSTDFEGDFVRIKGRISVAEAMDYPIKFNATTSGKGRLKLTLNGYQKTELTEGKIRGYKGVSPLDEAQWILHRRGAFKADERHV